MKNESQSKNLNLDALGGHQPIMQNEDILGSSIVKNLRPRRHDCCHQVWQSLVPEICQPRSARGKAHNS